MNTDLAVQRALDRLDKNGFDALTEADKTLAAVWQFDAGVENNGFAKYFASRRGKIAFHAPAALQAIGANQLAGIAAEANAVFGTAGPPQDYDSRRALVRGFDERTLRILEALEERFYACPEDSDELLEAFLTRINKRAEGRD
jgi:hypothetical protein